MTAQMVLEFDTPEWRQVRDHKLREWVQDESALAWFLDFCHVCEFFDDMADQDKPISKADVATALFAALVEMPTNSFFTNHRQVLAGVIITGINAWLDANELEKTEYPAETKFVQREDAIKAFCLRDWYMELLAVIIYLTAGPDQMRKVSLEARRFFQNESFVEYVRKLGAQKASATCPRQRGRRTCKMSGGGGGSSPAPAAPQASSEERALYSSQAEIAREQWDEYKRLGVPIQESLAAEASAPISESEYATNIGRAGADVDQAYDKAGTEFRSSLGRYGLNPGSGRFASGLRSLALGRAADKSGAMTGARGALQHRRDRLRHGVLAGLQGQAGQAQQGLASAAGGYGGIVNRAQQAQARAQQARGQSPRSGYRPVCWAPAWWRQQQCIFSDPRLKDDMGTVGKLDSGIPVHIFRYKDSPRVHMGVMADEAEKIRPEAVGRHKSGLAVVDYMKVAA